MIDEQNTDRGRRRPSAGKRTQRKGKLPAESKKAPEPAQRPALRDPSDREQARIAVAQQRLMERAPPPKVAAEHRADGVLSLSHGHSDGLGWEKHLRDTFGTASYDLAGEFLMQAANAARSEPAKPVTSEQVNAALAIVHGIAPRDEAEAMLAVQMAGTHAVAMTMLQRAHLAKTVAGLREYSNVATKMQRTFAAQIDALAKLRRGGEQTVRVEHVHVYEGGQAIVGNVTQPGGGDSNENAGQGHAPNRAQAVEYAPGTPVRSADPLGDAVPRTGGQGQETMPDARRSNGDRRA